MSGSTDRITKSVVLKAPRTRVWRALTDSGEFGTWFRAELDDPFVEGRQAAGHITYPGYEGTQFRVVVERMEPERLFAFRWHPDAEGEGVGTPFSGEPTTLVEFRLEEAEGGTRLTVVESGFDALPPERRDKAFRSNDKGWAEQMSNIQHHVDG